MKNNFVIDTLMEKYLFPWMGMSAFLMSQMVHERGGELKMITVALGGSCVIALIMFVSDCWTARRTRKIESRYRTFLFQVPLMLNVIRLQDAKYFEAPVQLNVQYRMPRHNWWRQDKGESA